MLILQKKCNKNLDTFFFLNNNIYYAAYKFQPDQSYLLKQYISS